MWRWIGFFSTVLTWLWKDIEIRECARDTFANALCNVKVMKLVTHVSTPVKTRESSDNLHHFCLTHWAQEKTETFFSCHSVVVKKQFSSPSRIRSEVRDTKRKQCLCVSVTRKKATKTFTEKHKISLSFLSKGENNLGSTGNHVKLCCFGFVGCQQHQKLPQPRRSPCEVARRRFEWQCWS